MQNGHKSIFGMNETENFLKNLGRQGVAHKASSSDLISGQQNIVNSISNSFLDFQ